MDKIELLNSINSEYEEAKKAHAMSLQGCRTNMRCCLESAVDLFLQEYMHYDCSFSVGGYKIRLEEKIDKLRGNIAKDIISKMHTIRMSGNSKAHPNLSKADTQKVLVDLTICVYAIEKKLGYKILRNPIPKETDSVQEITPAQVEKVEIKQEETFCLDEIKPKQEIVVENNPKVLIQMQPVVKRNAGAMKKSEARMLCWQNGIRLGSAYTFAAINASAPLYWANPNIELLEEEWYFVLNNTYDKILYVLKIPAYTFKPEQFYIRSDRNQLNIRIPYNDMTFTDYQSGVSFGQFLIATINY